MNTTGLPAEDAFSVEELETCVRVLRAIEADRSHLTRITREQRRELLTLAGLVSKPERFDLVKMAKAFRRAEREAVKEQDRKAIEQAGLRVQRRAAEYTPLWLEPPKPEDLDDRRPELNQERACYVCKKPFVKVHRYYDSMCEACGDFNYAKREQTADLSGHYALVTGARVKIGYQAALKLLRAGAHVVVTTRFPVDAAERYSREADFAAFKDRLQIHGLDLRHTPSVELFTRFLLERLPRLDYILNNACQTVRRPAGFFQHLLDREAEAISALPSAWRGVLASHDELRRTLAGQEALNRRAAEEARGAGLLHSAALSQRRYLDEDFVSSHPTIERLFSGDPSRPAIEGFFSDDSSRPAIEGFFNPFPEGRFDEDRQQVDLREVNSWRLRMHEVETPELLEVHLVNAIAPYILNARLKPLMVRTEGRHKHIVNVSAMEGQFYRATKTDKHPHTNMAKAALNMMTRTSAPDYVKDGIHMNAVDTGWVTDEDPAIHAARKAEAGFSPPLDIIDGAARIVDPIFVGRITGTHVWGQFLKDYKPAPW
jgi:NAD(P)-dependent dehydrogenase (short-subunit alcohol dehydrogenase family)